jgi:hypothetical protein
MRSRTLDADINGRRLSELLFQRRLLTQTSHFDPRREGEIARALVEEACGSTYIFETLAPPLVESLPRVGSPI